MDRGKRGRPLGFRLSEYSKTAISRSKTGQKHSQETKDKISKALMSYFKKLNPLSREIEKRYCGGGNVEISCWMDRTREYIDSLDDIRTSRSMKNSRSIEVSYGQNIEGFSHDLTPEKLLELLEECIEKDIDTSIFKDFFEGSK